LAHYHKGSNVEITFSMIKTKFGQTIRSKSEVASAEKNHLAYICCLIARA